MKTVNQTRARRQAESADPGRNGQLIVINPTVPPARLIPRSVLSTGPSLIDHYVASLKERLHMRIERKRAQSALPTLRMLTVQAKLATEYQNSLNALSLAEVEREVKLAELQQRKLELGAQRRQLERIGDLRVQNERLKLQVEIAAHKRQIRDYRKAPQTPLTAVQQRLLKKKEVQAEIERLSQEESQALQHGTSELEKRRLQNMYAARREELMQQLEKYL